MSAWSVSYRLLLDTNLNELGKKRRGTILKSQCYGRENDLVKSVSQDDLRKDNGWLHIVKVTHKIDPLQFVSDVYLDFNSLISTCRGQNETKRNFETQFDAQISRFNSPNAGKVPDALVPLMLLSISNIDDNQRVLILAAAVSNVVPANNTNPTVV